MEKKKKSEKMRELKGRKGGEEITSPGSRVDTAGVFRVLGVPPGLCGGTFLYIGFPHPGDKFLASYAN